EILRTPGFERARRFRAVRSSELPERPDGEWHSNLVIYDVVADDLAGAYAGLIDRMNSGQLTRSDVFSDERPYRAMLFERTFEAPAPGARRRRTPPQAARAPAPR